MDWRRYTSSFFVNFEWIRSGLLRRWNDSMSDVYTLITKSVEKNPEMVRTTTNLQVTINFEIFLLSTRKSVNWSGRRVLKREMWCLNMCLVFSRDGGSSPTRSSWLGLTAVYYCSCEYFCSFRKQFLLRTKEGVLRRRWNMKMRRNEKWKSSCDWSIENFPDLSTDEETAQEINHRVSSCFFSC